MIDNLFTILGLMSALVVIIGAAMWHLGLLEVSVNREDKSK